MRTALLTLALGSLTTLAIAQAPPAQPAGVSMPESRIEVRILDGVATTTVRQTIHNHGARDAEAEWLLPLPVDAVTDDFTMTVGGVLQEGSVLDATQARTVYERIVRQRRDPGLLRYAGRGCLQANIFPVPPGQDVVVEVTYRQVLPDAGGLYRWSFPGADAGVAGRAPELLVLDLEIESTSANLTNVFSPTPGLHLVQDAEVHARASLEVARPRLGELEVLFGLGGSDFGMDLMSYVEAGEADGSFALLISPRRDWDDERIAKKEITFVVDISGSMDGEKMRQAKQALLGFLGSLGPADRFNIVPFSTSADSLFRRPQPANAENLAKARERTENLIAAGGTNMESALRAALTSERAADEFVPITVFLTDGLPTVGERNTNKLLGKVTEWNQLGARIFVLGVGHDVNTTLLDRLAGEGHGTRGYVRPGESIEVASSTLFQELSHPVMTDLELELDGIVTSRQSPEALPDLFIGQRLTVVGRYEGAGPVQVSLIGMVAGQRRTYILKTPVAANTDPRFDFVPSLWAERRVAVLLDAMRLQGGTAAAGGELYDEVVRLGTRYGIITPYTSHLILEEGMQLSGGTMPTPGSGGGGGGSFAGPASPSPASPGAPATPTTGGRSHGGTYKGPGDSVPGSGAPATPGSPAGGTSTGSSDWFLGQGRKSEAEQLTQLVDRLVDLGVLPADAPRSELEALAKQVAAELRASTASLDGLGKDQSGKRAVDDSAYLAGLISSAESGAQAANRGESKAAQETARKRALLSLFTRHHGSRVLNLRGGYWTDSAFDAETMEPVELEAYSIAYFDLLASNPELAEVLAIGDRLVLVHAGKALRISPPAAPVTPEQARR
ncbi:MAG: VIT domain-containing protein [Planctomycetota bacterium]|nr:VIT domain-containing protein [Planctomycetota bacterium]